MTAILTRERELEEFVQRASGADCLALDTEFMRERTYYPELCLIQAATTQEVVLIDPLAAQDVSPLQALLSDGPQKILHACRQDQEVLATRYETGLAPLFDTQLAAAFCGYPPQWSYANLVKEFSGVELAKGATRTDWSRRPLSAHQLEYAADDVRYLIPARDALWEKLQALGRHSWFEEESIGLQTAVWEPDMAQCWRRVKGFGQLEGQALARLQQLAAWRETRAMQANKPRRWILSDAGLLNLARSAPDTLSAMQSVADVEPGLIRRRGEELLQLLRDAKTASIPELDQRIPDKSLMKRLRQQVQSVADELGLDSSLLATRSDLSQVALDGSCARLEQGWRKALLADLFSRA